MLAAEARAGACEALSRTHVCSGGIVAKAATPNRTIAAMKAGWSSAATATIADRTVRAPTET
ncbi:hypothetical protein ACFFV7_26685 [Nonomuraea spiralis]|uniref:Uncharacterized protein n=2 Tax=Nonomuraea spiralis TaxID=46182 RepID=A0ABV5IJU1_9ACTN|nr:hypothetical protein GCM10010176_060830 [Nonomuraea spiralis]